MFEQPGRFKMSGFFICFYPRHKLPVLPKYICYNKKQKERSGCREKAYYFLPQAFTEFKGKDDIG